VVVIPGRRASRFALGYFISRFQREAWVFAAACRFDPLATARGSV